MSEVPTDGEGEGDTSTEGPVFDDVGLSLACWATKRKVGISKQSTSKKVSTEKRIGTILFFFKKSFPFLLFKCIRQIVYQFSEHISRTFYEIYIFFTVFLM